METVTVPAQAAYEVHVQRQMIDLCRKIGRMQAALDIVLIKLEVGILPRLPDDWPKHRLHEVRDGIKAALAESEAKT